MLVSGGLMAGCSTPPPMNSASPRSVGTAAAQLPAPEYRLGFGDVIEIKFFNNERFNETVAVRPDGRMTMERIGDIFIAGMTPSKLDSLITAKYAEFVRNPDVTVFVRQFGGYQVYVLGEVNAPGGYPLQRNMTILQALAAAGGFKDTAKRGSVMVLRPGEQKQIEALKVDLTATIRGHNQTNEKTLYVQAQDVIYVPKTLISSTSAFLKQVYDGVLPPLDTYFQALWWRRR
jgi:protein involved in polysaccharide export with SLBB domain